MFSIHQLSHQYGSSQPIRFPDWEVSQGEKWLLTGTSGSGKTTLLHILAGLLRPTQGTVSIAGAQLYNLSGAAADRFRGRNIGLVLQKPHVLPTLNVEENLLLAQYFAGLRQDKTRIDQVLQTLQLSDKKKAMPATLSGGEAGRVAIARAVLNQPKLIVADEPTASLDDENCRKVIALLEQQAQACGATLMIATHDARVKAQFPQQLRLNSH